MKKMLMLTLIIALVFGITSIAAASFDSGQINVDLNISDHAELSLNNLSLNAAIDGGAQSNNATWGLQTNAGIDVKFSSQGYTDTTGTAITLLNNNVSYDVVQSGTTQTISPGNSHTFTGIAPGKYDTNSFSVNFDGNSYQSGDWHSVSEGTYSDLITVTISASTTS